MHLAFEPLLGGVINGVLYVKFALYAALGWVILLGRHSHALSSESWCLHAAHVSRTLRFSILGAAQSTE